MARVKIKKHRSPAPEAHPRQHLLVVQAHQDSGQDVELVAGQPRAGMVGPDPQRLRQGPAVVDRGGEEQLPGQADSQDGPPRLAVPRGQRHEHDAVRRDRVAARRD